MVSPAQLSVVRMAPIARRIARRGGGRLAVFRLLNSRRGWDTQHTPVDDVRWALDEVRDRLGARLPTCLVGHSLGGRAAVLAAGHPDVRSAVALAAYVVGGDAARGVGGRQILFVHGDHDRIASLQRARALATHLPDTADVGFVTVRGGKHAMLRHGRRFSGLAAAYAAVTLLGDAPDATIQRALGGAMDLSV